VKWVILSRRDCRGSGAILPPARFGPLWPESHSLRCANRRNGNGTGPYLLRAATIWTPPAEMMLIWPAHVAFAAEKASTSGASVAGVAGWIRNRTTPDCVSRGAALHRDLREVLVEGQDDASLGLRQFQQDDIACSGEVRSNPQAVVPAGSKRVHDGLRNAVIGEEPQLRRDRERLVSVGEVGGVCDAGEDVASRLASREEFQDELDGKRRAANHRLACQDLGIDGDVLRPHHARSLTCLWRMREFGPGVYCTGVVL